MIICAFLVSGLLLAQKAASPYQRRNPHFGVSGSNVKDATPSWCCGGTLGSLVTANGANYILSNNHIVARSDQAGSGEDISQPGLIDNNCREATIVADFSVAPLLSSNVDAGIAQLRTPLVMDGTGYIEGIGPISSTVKTASIGLAVAKSGRTTGTTRGTVSSTSTTVNVKYSVACGSNDGPIYRFDNQVMVTGNKFSLGGDSGSLIVTNDTYRQPVALLYAGSGNRYTIGNPIGEVLTQLGTALGGGSILSFVGSPRGSSGPNPPSGHGRGAGPSQTLVNYATTVKQEHEKDLMSRDAVIGVGVAADDVNEAEAVIVVYIDQTKGKDPALPGQLRGVRVKKIHTEPFVALGCCEACR